MKIKAIVMTGLLMATMAHAEDAVPDVNIKGFHLGMSQTEVDALEKQYCLHSFCPFNKKPRFEVGGGALLQLAGKVEKDKITFYTNASQFDKLMIAFTTKYPETKCEPVDYGNALGAHFTNMECRYSTPTTTVEFREYLDMNNRGDFAPGILVIRTTEDQQKADAKMALTSHDM